MGILDKLKAVFVKKNCEKWIQYDTNSLTIQGLSGEALPIKFNIAEFQTETKKIREVSEFSELLDNYQYQMCRICNELGREDVEWKKYVAIRTSMINLLTSLQGTLIALKNDPDGQKDQLNNISGKLQDYVLLVNREILPNLKELESKSTISKGDVPQLDPNTVSRAVELSGLEQNELDKFIEELERSS